MEGGPEQGVCIAPTTLCLLHCGLGVTKDVFRLLVVLRAYRDPNACGNDELKPFQNEGLSNASEDSFRYRGGIAVGLDALEKDCKLVPVDVGDPPRSAGFRDGVLDAAANLQDHLVAHALAACVVDGLEAIDIDEEQGETASVARLACPLDRGFDSFQQ